MTIIVAERGATTICRDEWLSVSADPGFQDLVSRSVLSARPSRRSTDWELTAGGYVGHAYLGGHEIKVVEKIRGALGAMTQVLMPRAFKLAKAASPVVHGRPPYALLAEMLVASVRSYLSGYALAEYRTDEETGAYLTGRLNVPRTVALRARGIRHKVAFTKNVLTDDLPVNRVIFRALGDIATEGAADVVGTDLAAAARSLRTAFGASAASARDLPRFRILAEAIAEEAVEGRHAAIADAVVLSLAILQGAGPTDGMAADGIVPRSWFINLELLFERMLRQLITESLGGSAQVTGPPSSMPLFEAPSARYPANPDVWIRGDSWTALADAKYKDRNADPEASEVYQLVAHASACGAERAALFYPSAADVPAICLGRSTTGCTVWAFSINLLSPYRSVRLALDQMKLP